MTVSTATQFGDDCSLMLHMDGANASTVFKDSSRLNSTVSPFGNAQISTAQSKFGGSSGLFDGTGDYIEAPDSSNFTLTGDFTIDAWVQFTDVTDQYNTICGQYTDDNNRYLWAFDPAGGGTLLFAVLSGGVTVVNCAGVTGNILVNTWHHVAVVHSASTNYKLFLDGSSLTTLSTGVNLVDYSGNFRIGARQFSSPTVDTEFHGYIEELRVVKGTQVWTSNFTPPSAAYSSNLAKNSSNLLLMRVG